MKWGWLGKRQGMGMGRGDEMGVTGENAGDGMGMGQGWG